MVELTSLIVPILVSAVLVFFASSLVHMVLPWHKGDYPKMANEDQVMDALRPFNIPPGDYMVPRPNSMEHMKSAEFRAKHAKGPVFMMTMMDGSMNMGPQLFKWFIYSIIVSAIAAFVASRTMPPGTGYGQILRVVGAVAFCSYTMAYWPMSIWYKRALRATITATVDGAIYAGLTAGAFIFFWPK
jgi:hypothetical protein